MIWDIRDQSIPAGQFARMALTEGRLILVLSEDPYAAKYVLETADGLRPSIRSLLDEADLAVMASDYPDRGWVHPETWGGDVPIRYGLQLNQKTSIVARVMMQAEPAGTAVNRDEPLRPPGLQRLLGDLPQGLMMMHPAEMGDRLVAYSQNDLSLVVKDLLAGRDRGPLFVGILGGEYSGRLRGLKLPALLAGLPVMNEAEGMQLLTDTLDELNARASWGLIATDRIEEGERIRVIESTLQTPYARFPAAERLACAYRDGWLLFSSNAASLLKVMKRREPSAGEPDWYRALSAEEATMAIWLNLTDSAKAWRGVIKLYSLKLLLEDPDETRLVRERMNLALAWIDALEPMRSAYMEQRQRGDDIEINLRLGGE